MAKDQSSSSSFLHSSTAKRTIISNGGLGGLGGLGGGGLDPRGGVNAKGNPSRERPQWKEPLALSHQSTCMSMASCFRDRSDVTTHRLGLSCVERAKDLGQK